MADVVVSESIITDLTTTMGGRCTAVTRKGHRCKNPIFHSQQWFFSETRTGHRIALMSAEDFERWKAGSCSTHYMEQGQEIPTPRSPNPNSR